MIQISFLVIIRITFFQVNENVVREFHEIPMTEMKFLLFDRFCFIFIRFYSLNDQPLFSRVIYRETIQSAESELSFKSSIEQPTVP